ncbi:MAG: ABC transporter permease [Candidatus Schekmanbacteria bacterium]|nr:ABC transporter permease [Candidatus Schekmanbacteria bacterium]
MIGFWIIVVLVLTALAAPLLANDRPIVAVYRGEVVFPSLKAYVDLWVPWKSLRYSLKSWQWNVDPPYFPFSEHYPQLAGKSWKEVDGGAELTFAIWPPLRWNPNQFDATALRLLPSASSGHYFGTDDQGRDILARLIHGTVVALSVGVISVGISAIIGIALGLLAGYVGGAVDVLLSRVTEVVMCFPTFFLIIAVIAFLEPSMINIMLVLGLVGWTGKFRLIRGEVLRCRGLEYVVAAEAMGVPAWRIMVKQILPNAIAPVFVSIAFGIASAVLTETSLSFLGFGDPTVPSWGEIVSQGRAYVSQGLWHLTVFPGIAIFVTLTAFNLFGQGMRDAMDPKLRA